MARTLYMAAAFEPVPAPSEYGAVLPLVQPEKMVVKSAMRPFMQAIGPHSSDHVSSSSAL